MPKMYNKAETLLVIEKTILLVAENDLNFENDKEIDELQEIYEGISSYRNLLTTQPIPKNREIRELLWQYPDNIFRQLARMDKQSFLRPLDMICRHTVFHTEAIHKQTPIYLQLFLVLSRLGCDGNGASIGRNAQLGGVSFGSIKNFTKRVFKAVIDV